MLADTLSIVIDRELVWREREMALAKIQLHRAIGDTRGFAYAYRCFATISYAHFEGFTKRILEQTLNDLVASGVGQNECGKVMQSNLFGSYARKIVERLSNAELIEKVFFTDNALRLIKFPRPEEVFDIASMTYGNFEKAVCCVGIDVGVFETYRAFINKITNLRHECAHGERISWDQTKTHHAISADMFYLQDKIHDVMHILAIQALERFASPAFQI